MKDFNFNPGYKGQVTVVNTDGKLFTRPETCKDYIHDAIMFALWPKCAKQTGNHDIGRTGVVNIDAPTFVLWTSSKTVDRNAIKFTQFMNQIESIMGLKPTVAYAVATGVTPKSVPFVAESDPWWMKSPVAVSAYLLFLRLSVVMRLNESFEDFIARTTGDKGKNYNIQRDIGYLKVAKKKGHLTGLFEKSLPCFNREDYSDYLLSNHGRGLSQYSLKADESQPMKTEELFVSLEARHNKKLR